MKCEFEKSTIYYEVYGEGRPLILLHGLRVDHRHMKSAMEPFFKQRQGWNRICFDMPGMGKSNQEGKWITSNDDMLEVVLDFIDHVIPDQRFVLAGTLYGAYMARGVLHQRQTLMDGLLLVVPAILPKETRTVPPKVTLVEGSNWRTIRELFVQMWLVSLVFRHPTSWFSCPLYLGVVSASQIPNVGSEGKLS